MDFLDFDDSTDRIVSEEEKAMIESMERSAETPVSQPQPEEGYEAELDNFLKSVEELEERQSVENSPSNNGTIKRNEEDLLARAISEASIISDEPDVTSVQIPTGKENVVPVNRNGASSSPSRSTQAVVPIPKINIRYGPQNVQPRKRSTSRGASVPKPARSNNVPDPARDFDDDLKDLDDIIREDLNQQSKPPVAMDPVRYSNIKNYLLAEASKFEGQTRGVKRPAFDEGPNKRMRFLGPQVQPYIPVNNYPNTYGNFQPNPYPVQNNPAMFVPPHGIMPYQGQMGPQQFPMHPSISPPNQIPIVRPQQSHFGHYFNNYQQGVGWQNPGFQQFQYMGHPNQQHPPYPYPYYQEQYQNPQLQYENRPLVQLSTNSYQLTIQ